MKSRAERSVEALTWASVVIWLGFALVAHILNYVWLIVMVLSIIFLSSAIYQRSQGWHTALSLWVFGLWMAVFSVIETVSALMNRLSEGAGLEIDLWVYLGVALVSMGVAVVFRTVQSPQPAANRPADDRRRRRDRDQDRDRDRERYIPRRVEEDYSTGWTPASSEHAGRRREQQTDYGYTAPTPQPHPQETDRTEWTTSPPTQAQQERRRPASRRPRPAQPVNEPSNLESRVEDIIRRSRERREHSTGEDLPY